MPSLRKAMQAAPCAPPIVIPDLSLLLQRSYTCKCSTLTRVQTSISLPFITATADGPKHIETNLSRAKFEELASDLLERCRIPVEQALKDANLAVSDINEVILVGGSTRIPAVQVCSYPVISSSMLQGVLVGACQVAGLLAIGTQDCYELATGTARNFRGPLFFGSCIPEWRVGCSQLWIVLPRGSGWHSKIQVSPDHQAD